MPALAAPRVDQFERISQLVTGLSPDRADGRETWLKIGMALKAFEDSQRCLDLWEEFSRQSGKYREGECERLWRGFKRDGAKSVSTATISWMHYQDNPGRKPSSGPAPAPLPRPAPEPSPTPPQPAQPPQDAKKHWKTAAQAAEAFAALPRAIESEQAGQFLTKEYGLRQIPEDWRTYTHPRLGRGIVYKGENPDGSVCYKFKSFDRSTDKKKRSIEYLYGAGGALILAGDPASAWVIVAGEEKAAAVASTGFNVLSPLTGENQLSTTWCERLTSYDPAAIILANDNDTAGRAANQKTMRALSDAGYPRLKIFQVVWPPSLPEGYDVNDALKDGLDLDAILRAAVPAHEGMSIMGVLDVFAFQCAEDDNLLADRAMSLGQLTSLIGPGGIGKSAIMFDLAVAMIFGWDWCTLQTYGAGRRWLFFQTENSIRRTKHNFAALTRGKSNDDIQYLSDRLRIGLPLRDIDTDVCLADTENIAKMRAEVQLWQPEIIVFDPLADYFAGENENDAMQMRETLRAVDYICRGSRHPTARIVVHHSRIGRLASMGAVGYEAGAYGRGSKFLYSKSRSQINVAPGTDDEQPPLVIVHGKNNDGQRFKEFAARLDPEHMRFIHDPTFDLEAWREGTKPKSAQQCNLESNDILDMLENGERRQAEITIQLMDTLGVSKSSVCKCINKLITEGKIKARHEGNGANPPRFIRLP